MSAGYGGRVGALFWPGSSALDDQVSMMTNPNATSIQNNSGGLNFGAHTNNTDLPSHACLDPAQLTSAAVASAASSWYGAAAAAAANDPRLTNEYNEYGKSTFRRVLLNLSFHKYLATSIVRKQ